MITRARANRVGCRRLERSTESRTQPLHLVQQRIDVGFRGEWIHDILQRELSSHAERLQRGTLVRILSEVQGLGESPMVGFIELLEQAVHAD